MPKIKDYFILHYKILNLYFLLKPKKLRLNFLYNIIATLYFTIIFSPPFFELAGLIYGKNVKFQDKIIYFGILSLHSMSVFRIFNWFFITDQYEKVLIKLREIRLDFEHFTEENLNNDSINLFLLKTLKKTEKNCLLVTIFFFSYITLNLTPSGILSYFNPTFEQWNPNLNKTSIYRDYAVPCWYPFDTSISDGYYFVGYFHQIITYQMLMNTFFALECLGVSTIMHLTSYLKVLGFIFQCIDKNINGKLSKVQIMDVKKQRLTKCIDSLRDIYKCVYMLDNVFSTEHLIQQICMASFMCCSVFLLTQLHTVTEMLFVSTQAMVAASAMFTLAWSCQNFTLEALDLTNKIYDLDWINYDIKTRKIVLFLMQRVQKPCYFTIGFGFPLDINIFLAMVKSSYSMYTFITQSADA